MSSSLPLPSSISAICFSALILLWHWLNTGDYCYSPAALHNGMPPAHYTSVKAKGVLPKLHDSQNRCTMAQHWFMNCSNTPIWQEMSATALSCVLSMKHCDVSLWTVGHLLKTKDWCIVRQQPYFTMLPLSTFSPWNQYSFFVNMHSSHIAKDWMNCVNRYCIPHWTSFLKLAIIDAHPVDASSKILSFLFKIFPHTVLKTVSFSIW